MAKVMATLNKAEDVEVKTTIEAKPEVKPVVIPPETFNASKDFDKKISASDEANAIEEENKPAPKVAEKPVVAEEKPAEEEIPAEQAMTDEEVEALLSRAEKVGLTREQATNFSNAEDLETTLKVLEARPLAQPVVKPAEKPAEKVEVKPYDSGLNLDEYDDKLVAAINKIGTDFQTRIAKLEADNQNLIAVNTEIVQRNQREITREHTDWFDKQLSGLGEDYEDVFGKGTIRDIQPASAEFNARKELDKEIFTIAKGYEAVGRKVPSRDELFKMALNARFNEKVKTTVTSATVAKIGQRAKQAIGRVVQRPGTTTAAEKALQANRDFDAKIAAKE